MNDLYEIIFENIEKSNLIPLINFLTQSYERVKQYSVCTSMNQDCKEINYLSNYLSGLFFKINDDFIYITLDFIKFDNLKILNPVIRVCKYSNIYDIEVNFTFKDVLNTENVNIELQLQNFSLNLKNLYQIKNVYCGLEPAKDIETRIFTNKILGPIKFIN